MFWIIWLGVTILPDSYTVPHLLSVHAVVINLRDCEIGTQKRAKMLENLKKSLNMEEIKDVLDNSGSLLYMESVLSESCEELEI
jgi:hypothetical protein